MISCLASEPIGSQAVMQTENLSLCAYASSYVSLIIFIVYLFIILLITAY